MIEAKWVKPKEHKVHVRVLLSVLIGDRIAQFGVAPETIGVTLGDIAALDKLVWPDGNWWWSDFLRRVPDQLCPIIRCQYPNLAIISSNDLADATFETWLAAQAQRFGGDGWLTIAPAPLPAAEPTTRRETRRM